jgi:hypothetical protein
LKAKLPRKECLSFGLPRSGDAAVAAAVAAAASAREPTKAAALRGRTAVEEAPPAAAAPSRVAMQSSVSYDRCCKLARVLQPSPRMIGGCMKRGENRLNNWLVYYFFCRRPDR